MAGYVFYFAYHLFAASQCAPLPETPHATQNVLNGGGRSYGTVVRIECEEGYFRTGHPVIHCMSNGSWSGAVPVCAKKHCFQFPEVRSVMIHSVLELYHLLFCKHFYIIGIICPEDNTYIYI